MCCFHCLLGLCSARARGVKGCTQCPDHLGCLGYGQRDTQRLRKHPPQAGIVCDPTSKDEAFLRSDTTNHSTDAIGNGLMEPERDATAVLSSRNEGHDL